MTFPVVSVKNPNIMSTKREFKKILSIFNTTDANKKIENSNSKTNNNRQA